jgi:hypothetical protein
MPDQLIVANRTGQFFARNMASGSWQRLAYTLPSGNPLNKPFTLAAVPAVGGALYFSDPGTSSPTLNPTLYKSTDGLVSATVVDTGDDGLLESLEADSNGALFTKHYDGIASGAGGQRQIRKSTDEGASWVDPWVDPLGTGGGQGPSTQAVNRIEASADRLFWTETTVGPAPDFFTKRWARSAQLSGALDGQDTLLFDLEVDTPADSDVISQPVRVGASIFATVALVLDTGFQGASPGPQRFAVISPTGTHTVHDVAEWKTIPPGHGPDAWPVHLACKPLSDTRFVVVLADFSLSSDPITGFWLSTDAGATWSLRASYNPAGTVDNGTAGLRLVVNPRNANQLAWAGVVPSAGPPWPVYVSEDGGETWGEEFPPDQDALAPTWMSLDFTSGDGAGATGRRLSQVWMYA